MNAPSNIITLAGARVTPVTIAQARGHYLQRLRLRGKRPNTLVAYARDLRDFGSFAESQDITLVGLVSDRLVARWLDRLGHRGLSPRTQARKLAVLSGLMHHGRTEGWLRHDPTRDMQVRFRTRRVVAPEMNVLLRMQDGMPADTPMQLRDRAMVRLALDAALRISELVDMDLYDPAAPAACCIDLQRLTVNVLGKGAAEGTAAINRRTADIVQAWVDARAALAADGERALFVSNRGHRITRQQAHNRLKLWAGHCGLPQLTWHKLRHRRIGDVVETLGLEAGQQVARHAHKSTTANIYGAHAAEIVRHQVRQHCDLDGRNAA